MLVGRESSGGPSSDGSGPADALGQVARQLPTACVPDAPGSARSSTNRCALIAACCWTWPGKPANEDGRHGGSCLVRAAGVSVRATTLLRAAAPGASARPFTARSLPTPTSAPCPCQLRLALLPSRITLYVRLVGAQVERAGPEADAMAAGSLLAGQEHQSSTQADRPTDRPARSPHARRPVSSSPAALSPVRPLLSGAALACWALGMERGARSLAGGAGRPRPGPARRRRDATGRPTAGLTPRPSRSFCPFYSVRSTKPRPSSAARSARTALGLTPGCSRCSLRSTASPRVLSTHYTSHPWQGHPLRSPAQHEDHRQGVRCPSAPLLPAKCLARAADPLPYARPSAWPSARPALPDPARC